MREAEVGRIREQLVGQLPVAEQAVRLAGIPAPAAEVDLVDRHRPGQRLLGRAGVEPVLVAPDMVGLRDDRRRSRRDLGFEGERIGLHAKLAGRGPDLELVAGAFADVGQEELPDARRPERAHRVEASVPGVEVADDGDRSGGRGPDGERRARDPTDLLGVGAEPLVEALVAALLGEVEVELAERRREGVRVVHREAVAVRVGDVELVGERQAGVGDRDLEDARAVGRLEAERAAFGSVDTRVDGLGIRAPDADPDAAAGRVGTEHVVGVAVLSRAQQVELVAHAHAGGSSSMRAIAVTGTISQSGRLLSS
jgi:hypothetical protein